MQVIGLPSHVIRNGRAASRLLAAKTPNIEAARRRDAAARWRRAMADGLTADQAASAVGVTRATLYRWEKKPEPLSRRPHRPRGRRWTSELARAVEDYRNDNPMWGKRKIAVLLGRDRARSSPAPQTRTAQQRDARRLPKGRKAKVPGERVQIDTRFINIRPDEAIKHITASDPVSKWTAGHVARYLKASGPKALLDKIVDPAPFKISGIQVDGGSQFKSVFEQECQRRGLELLVLPPKGQTSMAASNPPNRCRYEFYAVYDLPHRIEQLQACVDAFAGHFNTQRPHHALPGLTPAEYLKSRSFDDPAKSHMS